MLKHALTICFALATATAAHAQALKIDGVTPSESTRSSGIALDLTGKSMGQVLNAFGEPQKRHPTVSQNGGKHRPPITRWDYHDFSVIFEYDHVVHAVAPKRPPTLHRDH